LIIDVKQLLQEREKSLRLQIEAADARLAEITAALERDGLTVVGSRGQPRANPLLAVERELRRERSAALDELEEVIRRLDSERQLEAANAVWRRTPLAEAN
jgi:exonuclease VII small subunit